MGLADLGDREAYERELRRLAGGDRRRLAYFRRDVNRSVRKGEAVLDPVAAPLAIKLARRVQKTPIFPWYLVVAILGLGVLGFMIGGVGLYFYVGAVVPTVLTEPWRARRRRTKALSAEAANLALE